MDKLFKKKKKKTSSTLPKPSNDLSPTAAPLNILATAKFKFEATREDELSFSRGWSGTFQMNYLDGRPTKFYLG